MQTTKTYCTYLRVSTQKQGASGLGLEAQRKMCEDFIRMSGGKFASEFLDVESGTHRDRKGLWQAIDYCKKNNCALVIAKLDRLARDVEFTFKVINTGIEIHFTDMPQVNTMILGVFASVAQYERELISSRTKQALDAKKKRGEALGAATDKWQAAMTDEKRKEAQRKKGATQNRKHLESRDVQAFVRVLQNVFPEQCADKQPNDWASWEHINTKNGTRQKILGRMKEYAAFDSSIFIGWDFADLNDARLQIKLASYIKSLRRSVERRRKAVNKHN